MSTNKNIADVAVIMGSQSDFSTMNNSISILKELNITHEVMIISAHRTPERLYTFAKSAEDNGFKVIIAGAGGAAHLPGLVASLTHIPVIGVPVKSSNLNGIDSLLSIVQMPKGIPVATMSIGSSGGYNAAIMAASILSLENDEIRKNLKIWRKNLSDSVKLIPDIPL
ncbi:N5-carboxyaminoimidazole ribonucleotide mutase [Ehrlichia chaffeensis str. Heartland]|uniref:N5-carboxyaminoimidazole ribonucleotide mutase n=1 Tax=Ehrlichia chaffeensis (strain ATCC CRL-10679 / Arkansas) TaxID=205920 RepID=Q2GHU6_EHRCR|nr:5-(carboxyamino)imidazole ribonucleotide mutase [Ehrlichia chaffeensis]ABD45342.1 phosphoribosylaminoimidazole carboxylase, catalytic subunit [Ehrlichia chaffeensis str. Arkansas]AHX04043.1 N5-carboxyaminoimidazole ribonucleotide mutase [Ehrlichia chaffeensis str. Heartland]AHX05977.1 N5-carboxyaminoimidazole ribonucleotide mutase [Ehrlichia chaffeensis str. Jax]AHX06967.1 N5-carboxyaminoimidazole ribonucleotide mutase [Ehrlichia chaffeensis str. Liberty]AHX07083.1 N5-carboxyaminoimidazole 